MRYEISQQIMHHNITTACHIFHVVGLTDMSKCRPTSANTTSIPFIAEMKEFRQALSTKGEDESVHNIPSGKKYKPIAKKSNVISSKWPKRSNRDFSMDIKVSLQPLNFSDLSNKRLSAAKKTKNDGNYGDWELGLDVRYKEEEVISIMNMLSYLDNQRRGHGKGNDEPCYKEERLADTNDRLYNEAVHGLELLERGRVRKKD